MQTSTQVLINHRGEELIFQLLKEPKVGDSFLGVTNESTPGIERICFFGYGTIIKETNGVFVVEVEFELKTNFKRMFVLTQERLFSTYNNIS